ncbi:MAG TPA: hypothetical protein VLT16_13710 [Candidatus Limnocylindrales bacterium]|nr:hypothetical protein [Candidatus Limnocylindrales bacterium]
MQKVAALQGSRSREERARRTQKSFLDWHFVQVMPLQGLKPNLSNVPGGTDKSVP